MFQAYRMITRYRYRTETLVGPWRATRREAEQDAVAAGQAELATAPDGPLTWRVTGEIEAKDEVRVRE